MYRHILVPLDDSQLAVETVNQAVRLAKTLGAKLTFFHAQADYGASGVGALERVMAPGAFNEHMAGDARAIVAKAEVVARVAGVPYDLRS
jgi:nucleotide-binding universal stress UspA family protein